MNERTVAVIVAAVVLFVVAVVGAMAFTGSDSGSGNEHQMPNGQVMGGMIDDSMMGHTMTDGQTMIGPMHTMSGGEQMPGMTHP